MRVGVWIALLVVLGLWAELGRGQTVQYVGRVQKSAVGGAVEFEWSNIEVHVSFRGRALNVIMESNDNVFEVYLNGVSVGRINTTSSAKSYPVVDGLSTGATHTVILVKRTEALFGLVQLHGFAIAGELDSRTGKQEMTWLPARPLEADVVAPADDRRIEFIGDSISCGYGIDGRAPCPFTPGTENSIQTYGSLVARSLRAQLHLECWSGMGVVRNFGDKNSTSAEPFPALFPRTVPTIKTSAWHFDVWVPQAVVINLGTNDYSTQPVPPQEIFEEGYTKFVEYIHTQYKGTDRSPRFFLACGPMISQPCCSYVKNVVEKMKANDEVDITYIDMQHILEPGDIGCAGHPSVSGHKKMAAIAEPIIKAAMLW